MHRHRAQSKLSIERGFSGPVAQPQNRNAHYGERGDAVREMACLLISAGGCWGPIEAAHTVARGMGGMNGDRRHLVPMCCGHHRISGALAPSDFVARYKIDLHAEAERIAAELDACGIP